MTHTESADRQHTDTRPADDVWRPGTSKAHRIAFRSVSVATFLWMLGLMAIMLVEPVAMSLPTDTMESAFGDDYELPIAAHRTHFFVIGLMAWIVVLSLAAQLRRPQRRVAPLLVVLVPAAAIMFIFPPQGRVVSWLLTDVLVAALLVATVALHPRATALRRFPRFDRSMLALATPAAVAFLVVAGLALREQFGGGTDEHIEMNLWSAFALFALVMAVAGLAGATRYDGWRLPAWSAAVASTAFGVHSLVFPGNAGTPALPLAIALVIWGVGYAALILRRGTERC